MRALSAAEIIQIWEIGQRQSALDRALTMLGIAGPNKARGEWAALEIGERDAQLFMVREQTFGSELQALVDCPECENRLEIMLHTAALCAPREKKDVSEPLIVSADGHEIRFRLPNSFDIADAARIANATEHLQGSAKKTGTLIERALLRRCIESAWHKNTQVSFEEVPAAILDSVNERMSEADPRSEIQLDLRCPACSHVWTLPFDIASFLWAEIGDRARRLLSEVHTIASAYGWREAEILALSPQRRQFYLERIGA